MRTRCGDGDSLNHLQPASGVPEPLTKQLHAWQPQAIAAEVHPHEVLIGYQSFREVLAGRAGHLAPLQPGEGGRREEPAHFLCGSFVDSLPPPSLPPSAGLYLFFPFSKIEERRVVARGWEELDQKSECSRCTVSFWCDENPLVLGSGDVCTIL